MLSIVLTIVMGLLLVALVAVQFASRRQMGLLAETREQTRLLEEAISAPSSELVQSEPELLLTVRVKDPIALAKRESTSARFVADWLPVLVKKKVYEEIRREIALELGTRDIEADLDIEFR